VRWVDPEGLVAALAARHQRIFWLDGAAATPRLSVVGWQEPSDESLTFGPGEDPFEPTAHLLARLRPHERLVGWFGYAARTDLPARRSTSRVPDSLWMRARRYLLLDHDARSITPVGFDRDPVLPRARPGADVVPLQPQVRSWPLEAYTQAFHRVQQELYSGNTYETNLTYRVEVASSEAPLTVYRRLRRVNPAPYAAFLQHDGVAVLSSSPERFVRVEDGRIQTRPIKGTTPRRADPEEDAAQAQLLTTDARLRAENLIVTDLLRNDLSMVCRPGTVTVPDLMRVESYASVHQLVTTVTGELAKGVGVVEAVRELSPAGSMTGAPKRRTMELIADVEGSARGVYSGSLGWLSPTAADLAVVIRTLVYDGSRYVAGTGGGITTGSQVADEREEAEHKLARLLQAVGVGSGR
jgi:para-aminobenzoate synthetase